MSLFHFNKLIHTFIITLAITFIHSQIRSHYLYSIKMVGSAGFEPTTSGTQNPNHAKLDHDPDVSAVRFSPIKASHTVILKIPD